MAKKAPKIIPPATLDSVQAEIKNLGKVLSKTLSKGVSDGLHSGFTLGATKLETDLANVGKKAQKLFHKGFTSNKAGLTKDLMRQMQGAFKSLEKAAGSKEFKGMSEQVNTMLESMQATADASRATGKPMLEFEKTIAEAKILFSTINGMDASLQATKKSSDLIKDSFSGILIPLDKMIERLNKIPIIGKFLGSMVTVARDEIVKKLSSDLMKGLVDGAMNFAKTWPKTIILLALVVLALAAIIGKFVAVQKAVQKVADETMVVNNALRQVQTQMVSAVRTLSVYGVTLEVAGQAWVSIYKIQGMTGLESQKLVNTTALMVSNLGMTADDAANALITFRAMGNATDAQAASMVAVVANAAEMAGMSPGKIIGDMAKNSKFLMMYMRDSGKEAAKLAMQSERMGISLETAGKSTAELLEWDTSIEKEMNATVMLGRQINFQKARALAFDGKIAESQEAVFEQLPKLVEWNNLNFIKKKAIAEAAGMEVDEIGKSLKQQDMISKLGYVGEQQYKNAIASLEKMQELDGETMLRDKQKQVALTRFTQAWDGLMSQLTLFFMPFFEKILIPGLNTATNLIRGIAGLFGEGGDAALILGTIIIGVLAVGLVVLIWKMISFAIAIKAAAVAMAGLAAVSKTVTPPSGGVAPGAGGGIGGFFKSINPMSLIKGAAALLIAAGAIYVLGVALNQFNTVIWDNVWKAGIALAVLIGAILLLGAPGVDAIAAVGATILLAIGAAAVLFGLGMLAAGAGMKLFSEGMTTLLPQFILLAGVAPQLILASMGIYAISAALGAFALASAGTGLVSFFAGNPFAPFIELASIAGPLTIAATAIALLTKSLKEYSDLDAEKIAKVTSAIGPVNDKGISNFSEKGNSSINELIAYFKNGSWIVNIDGKKAGDLIFANYPGSFERNQYS